MATDITGIWDFTWTYPIDDILKPVSTPNQLRVCFVSRGGDRYRGRYYDPELSQRSYPNWPYDNTFDAQVLGTGASGQGYDVVSVVVSFRSSENVAKYDAYEAMAGQVRTDLPGEPPYMFGVLYGNNGDAAGWKMTKNVSLGGCPDDLFKG